MCELWQLAINGKGFGPPLSKKEAEGQLNKHKSLVNDLGIVEYVPADKGKE